MCSCLCFFDFRFIFVIIKYSPVLFNNFASGAADIGDQLVFRCSRPVFKLSGEINLMFDVNIHSLSVSAIFESQSDCIFCESQLKLHILQKCKIKSYLNKVQKTKY